MIGRRGRPIRKAGRTGCLWAVAWSVIGLAGLAVVEAAHAADGSAPPPAQYRHAVIIRFEGEIMPLLEQYFYRKLDQAREDGADLLIVEIESPGGLVEQSLRIAERLRDIDWARTVAYVPRQALSGAAFVALGCDEIVMGENAMLGDAGPIFMGEDAMFHHVPEKIRSHLAARIRHLAQAKGRPPALAEAMVDMDLVVYRVQNSRTGRETFMSQAEIDSDDQPGLWEKVKPVHESREDHFLEVSGVRGVELGLVQTNVESRQALAEHFGLDHPPTILEPTGLDTAISVLNWPLVTGLLFVIGLVALYVEFSAPGIGMGILTAGLCFVLFFWSRFLGGTAGWLELILFLAGLAFLAVELFILPGFGVAGLTGALLLLASLILAGQGFLRPSNAYEWKILSANLLVVSLSGVTFVALAVLLSRHFGSLPFLSRLTLAPPEPTPAVGSPSGDETAGGGVADAVRTAAVQVGDTGIADSGLRPAGKARFGPRYVDVITDGDFIAKGTPVKVARLSGNRVVVSEVIT